MGLLGGTNELSLGNGSRKEREVGGSIEVHLSPERVVGGSYRMNH